MVSTSVKELSVVAPPPVRHVPLMAKQPLYRLIPWANVEVAVDEADSCPCMFMFEVKVLDALEIKPLVNVESPVRVDAPVTAKVEFSVAAPSTFNVPCKSVVFETMRSEVEASPVMVKSEPVALAKVRSPVSPVVPVTVRLSVSVTAPSTFNVLSKSTAPVTSKVLLIVVEPDARSPAEKVEVANVEVPVTFSSPAIVSVLPNSKVSSAFERRKSEAASPPNSLSDRQVPLIAKQPL